MNICIPVLKDDGLESRISGHFGSAPCFAVVDTQTRSVRVVANANSHHAHGGCRPVAAMAGLAVEGVLVGGIGAGALSHLQSAGLRVWKAGGATIGAALDAFNEGAAVEITPATACVHHDHGQGGHGHGHGPGEGHGHHGGCGAGGNGHGLQGLPGSRKDGNA